MPSAVVTGANTGIGFHVAGQLAARGYDVVLGCRSLERAEEALQRMKADYGGNLSLRVLKLDLSSFASVQTFAKEFADVSSLDLLVCNAGLNAHSVPQGVDEQLSEDGVDRLYQTNFLSHFLLVLSLLPQLRSARGRVVSVSSIMHRHASSEHFALVSKKREPYISFYGLSKLAQLLQNLEFHRRFGRDVAFHAVNPGGVASDIWRNDPAWLRTVFWAMFASPATAATTIVEMCVCQEGAAPAAPLYANGYRGASFLPVCEYWSPCPARKNVTAGRPSSDALNTDLAKQLWDESIVALRTAGINVAAFTDA